MHTLSNWILNAPRLTSREEISGRVVALEIALAACEDAISEIWRPQHADLLEALELMLVSPHEMLEYCEANNLLPDPITVESSVPDYWRKAIAKKAIEKAKCPTES